ncbi:hypothetical protein C1I98_20875 [Spongiactinospora gelatinilytica]|uniref:Uncharacterized protein n=1 Tax=Spongiactinospora gelatinilytica TaxID=2666298 RepID=A0A2W2GWV6_9ACTN|nr:hypothetical protein [Spongiactinospora gelatinilytica]PZG41738.1 hypothetical protein C1I98_20875 [Spongiactinospora gelatinilytica]
MSFQEKRAWVYAVVTLVVPAAYFVTVLGQEPPVAYVAPMLIAIGAGIAANILGVIGSAISAPEHVGLNDERDKSIDQYGKRAGYGVLAIGAVAALALTLARFEHFWIANALYLGFVLDGLTTSVVKIVAYRRGF